MKYDITPLPKPRMTRSDKWKQRAPVVAYFAYKDKLKEAGATMTDSARLIFWMPMPPSWSKKRKRESLGQPHQQTPDIDNLVKGLMDAIFEKDEHVWCIHAEKRWAENGSIEILEAV